MEAFFVGYCLGVLVSAALACVQNRREFYRGFPSRLSLRIEARRKEAAAASRVERYLEECRRGGRLVRRIG